MRGAVDIANVLSHLLRECLEMYCREMDIGRFECLLKNTRRAGFDFLITVAFRR
jgi:hypothetical protein